MTGDKSILVLGAGELGAAVLASLNSHSQRRQWKLAVALRADPHTSADSSRQRLATDLDKHDVEIVIVDVVRDSIQQLAENFARFHTVIGCNGMTLPPETQVKIARAVLLAQVKRYFPWQFGLDYDAIGRGSGQDLFDKQLDVRELLRAQSTTEWVIVSTGLFTSFLFDEGFGIVNKKKDEVTGLGSLDNELTVTSPQTIGLVVADIALACPDIKGVVYASDDTITYRRLADVIRGLTGLDVQKAQKTVEELGQDLEQSPDDVMRKYRLVFGKGIGTAWPMEKSFNIQKGLQPQSVEQYIVCNDVLRI